jgi:hypothetical protein
MSNRLPVILTKRGMVISENGACGVESQSYRVCLTSVLGFSGKNVRKLSCNRLDETKY